MTADDKRLAIGILALAVFLLVPFMLREDSRILEPYPAVLLPSGAAKISVVDGQVPGRALELVAIRADGTEETIDPRQFFTINEIPSWPWIAGRGFGLADGKSKQATIGSWTLSVATQRAASDAQRKEAIQWLKQRLASVGIPDAQSFQVRQLKIQYDINSRTIVDREAATKLDVQLND